MISGLHSSQCEDEQCSKDDVSCSGGTRGGLVEEAEYEAYKHKLLTSREDFRNREILDRIDTMKAGQDKQRFM